MKLLGMDALLFAATAGLSVWSAKAASSPSADAELRNSAFVFVKPHANTKKVQDLVRSTLKSKGVSILSEAAISGEVIDEKKLIDQHYYAIGRFLRWPLWNRLFHSCLILSFRFFGGLLQPPRLPFSPLRTFLFLLTSLLILSVNHGILC